MDATLHKEAVLKARLKPWLDEAYTVTSSIEGNFANLQASQHKLQVDNSRAVTEQMVKDVK